MSLTQLGFVVHRAANRSISLFVDLSDRGVMVGGESRREREHENACNRTSSNPEPSESCVLAYQGNNQRDCF